MADETESTSGAGDEVTETNGGTLPSIGTDGAGGGSLPDAPTGSETVPPIAEALVDASGAEEDVDVEVAYEVIRLLSSQLYSSPLKAVEELVVNSWDADAEQCFVYVPNATQLTNPTNQTAVAVLDDGHGMTVDDLRSLWHVGMSAKRDDAWKARAHRKQIGKFGIGKLASYVLARRVTYITRPGKNEPPRGVTIDFEDFRSATDIDGNIAPIRLQMLRIDYVDRFLAEGSIDKLLQGLGAPTRSLSDDAAAWDHWTLVVLENIKPKAREIREGRLRWY